MRDIIITLVMSGALFVALIGLSVLLAALIRYIHDRWVQ